MSLKAKIEAVIYASDEPVTLAQLVGLLGHEAQAELDREAEAQQMLALDDAAGAAQTVDATSDSHSHSHSDDTPQVKQSPGTDAASSSDGGEATPLNEASTPDPDSSAAEPVATTPEVETSETYAATDSAEAETDSAAGEAALSAAAARAEKARATKLRAYFRFVVDRLIAEYAAPESDRGLEIREVAGGFRFATKPEYHDAVRGFVRSLKPPLKLTLQALETLAVVAYKQPVTSPEISEIRGVDSNGVLGSLIARKLITTAGRKQVIGRPILYKTTKDFLLKFGLKDVAELPSIEEFEQMAGQMVEQEEIAMGEEAVLEPLREPLDAAELEAELGQETEAFSPPADGDNKPADADHAPVDDVSDETGDRASVDGRISSLPPDYDEGDPSADEAKIQEQGQQQEPEPN